MSENMKRFVLLLVVVPALLVIWGRLFPAPYNPVADGSVTTSLAHLFNLADSNQTLAPRLELDTWDVERWEQVELKPEDEAKGIVDKWCIGINYLLKDPGRFYIRFKQRAVYFTYLTIDGEWVPENLYEDWGIGKNYNNDYENVWRICLEQ